MIEKARANTFGYLSGLWREIAFSLRVMTKPFDGYWDLKHEKRGSVRASVFIILCMLLATLAHYQFSGFFFVKSFVRDEVSIIREFLVITVPFALWVISSWCFTTLMDGEGSMKDIFIATAYALVPMIIINLPLVFISNLVTLEEGAFIDVLKGIGIVWSGFLIFSGTLVTHQYSIGKGLLTILVTLAGMGILLFLALLVATLLQQVLSFFIGLYQEIGLRLL
ncbi:MAG: YIP1 family protein [Clostridiales bacterium]|jgi:hypothetical protein|nr:YIP1 family protein [Clostridiales bacterium]